MRKNLKFNLVLAALFVFASCDKFLDITPRTQTPQDVLLNSEAGFKDALTGVYIQLKTSPVYGRELTYGAIESLVSSWDVTANSTSQRIGLFLYEDEGVQNTFENIYRQAYTAVASANALLDKIDDSRAVFKNEELYRVIKGELLAIRAYLHLDVLRLFGPVPTAIDPSVRLPYVTTLSTTPNVLISPDAYLTALFADLSAAEELLKDIDPILQYSIAELRSPAPQNAFNPSDLFLAYRYIRMNFYAVKGLQARAYLWAGDTQAAYAAAKTVIDAKDRNGNATFRLGVSSDFTSGNFVLTPEHVFGLYDFNLFQKYENDFNSGTFRKGTTTNTTIRNQLYGNTGVDIRESNLWEIVTHANQSRSNIIKKYKVAEAPTNLASDFKQIPMIRLSELYLIAAEAAPLGEAQTYWDAFKAARNLPSTPLEADIRVRQLEIVKEYRKEFYAEGQGFFAYKRINAPKSAVLFAPAAAVLNYVVPLPKAEIVNLD